MSATQSRVATRRASRPSSTPPIRRCGLPGSRYTSIRRAVPKLWTETVAAHRRAVRDAILETTAALVTQHGVTSVTMSQIAEETGIGRATLYKYFPEVEAILIAWLQRHIARHFDYLVQVRDQASDAGERLETVLEAYALITYERRHGTELAALIIEVSTSITPSSSSATSFER